MKLFNDKVLLPNHLPVPSFGDWQAAEDVLTKSSSIDAYVLRIHDSNGIAATWEFRRTANSITAESD